jgi:hypothetical protein
LLDDGGVLRGEDTTRERVRRGVVGCSRDVFGDGDILLPWTSFDFGVVGCEGGSCGCGVWRRILVLIAGEGLLTSFR